MQTVWVQLSAGSPRLWSWVISSTWPRMAIMAITRVTHGVPGEGAFCGWGCYPLACRAHSASAARYTDTGLLTATPRARWAQSKGK
jgi:hypothetical protein